MPKIMKAGRVINSEALNLEFILNEKNRKTKEVERINDENTRKGNEQTRIINENKRIQEFQQKMQDLENTDTAQFNNRVKTIETELQQKAKITEVVKKGYGTLNDFDENTRAILQGLTQGQINAVLGLRNVYGENIANGVVTYDKIPYFESVNQYDKRSNDNIDGQKLMWNNTTEVSSSWTISHYIPVKTGDLIRTNVVQYQNVGVFYNSNFERVASLNNPNFNTGQLYFEYEVPTGCSYVRITFGITYKNTVMFIINQDYPDTYVSYKNEVTFKQNVIATTTQNERVYYVSPTGDDYNDGLSQTQPFATFQRAISVGARKIIATPGDYIGQTIVADNLSELEIITRNVYTTNDFQEKKPVRLINAVDVPLTYQSSSGLYYSSFTATSNPNWKKVFIDKTMPIEDDGYVTNPTMVSYNVILWEVNNTKRSNLDTVGNDKKLIPVLTKQECQTTEGSFFYDGSHIYINPTGGKIDNKSYKRLVNESGKTASFTNIKTLTLLGVDFSFGANENCFIENVNKIDMQHCTFSYSCYSTGLKISVANGIFTKCYAYKNRIDGIGISSTGDTHFYDCEGLYNYDDGISHHDKCTGSIVGGEWHHNGKGGISPAHGTKVDVNNTISHDNKYGFYCEADASTIVGRKVRHVGNVAYNNNIGISVKNYHVVVYNCKYDNNTKPTQVTDNTDSSLIIL